MKYILIDKFNNTETIKTEKELRDLYYNDVNDIIFNWKNCGDETILKKLEKEKSEVYTCDFYIVKTRLEEDNWFYKIKEVK